MAFNGKDLLAHAIQHSFKSAYAIKGVARMPLYATLSAGYRFRYPAGRGQGVVEGGVLRTLD